MRSYGQHGPQKGLGARKVQRANREKFITLEEAQTLLKKVAELRLPKWRRDHCAIFCGYFFGLRASEAVLLCRETFRDLQYGQVHIRTTKQGVRVPYTCRECKRRYRVSAARAGQEQACGHCGTKGRITLPQTFRNADTRPPEKSPPVVESAVIAYVQKYLSECMRPDQQWLFEGAPGRHLHRDSLRAILNHYLMAAGLCSKYSWHALRHGRGVLVYDKFDDLVMVRDSLRQKSLSAAEFYVNLSPKKQAAYRSALDDVVKDMDVGV